VKFLCEQCKAKYQIADEKVVGKTVRMKCRKCGHLIELRSEITESRVMADSLPLSVPVGHPEASARPVPRPHPPRPSALATSLTRPIGAKPDRAAGGLAGAFKTSVQREDEASAPFDMSELSPGSDWYVAINGVPVGPVRTAEIRRKAVLGAVGEDSLVWQEGLDEWRPLKSFPELAATIRGAAAARPSFAPPPPEARFTAPPPQRASSRPAPGITKGLGPKPSTYAAAPPARSNVVALSSRLATAEKLPESARGSTVEAASALVAPVSVAPAAAQPIAVPAAAPLPSFPPPRPRRSVPWIPIGMVVMAGAFGVTLAIQRAAPPPPPVVVQAPAPASAPPHVAPPPAPTVGDVPVPETAPTSTSKMPTGVTANQKAAPATSSPGRSLDLHGLGTTVALSDDSNLDGPKAAGQCLSEGQVQRVVQLHQVTVRRACWERSGTTRASVNINVMLTVAGDGSAQGVSATGDDPAVAHCIENDVRSWRFPAMGCTQRTAIPFKFLLQ
jgi:predicted Zn finger-like uncharacterized protein